MQYIKVRTQIPWRSPATDKTLCEVQHEGDNAQLITASAALDQDRGHIDLFHNNSLVKLALHDMFLLKNKYR